MQHKESYFKGFIPYALSAFLIGLVGGFSTVLGPAFVRDLGIPYSSTTWTALAQAMSTAALAPVLGKLGDTIGRRTTLLLGIAVYTLGNVLSAFASSLLFMLLARFVVGIGSAAVTPVVISYIVAEFPREKTAKGFALYMLISSGAVIFGPTLGGLIVARSGWRSMLWVCVGICAAVFLSCLLLRSRETTARSSPAGFDATGAALILLFFSLALCIPSFGQTFGWTSRPFLWVTAAAVPSLAALILAEHRAARPILSGTFMRRRAFVLSVLALILTQGLMQANMTNLIVFVNYTQPENTIISSYAISIMYLGMSLGAVVLGPLADRLEPKFVLTGSLLLTGAGCAAMLLFSQRTPAWLLMAALGLLGFGLGANGTVFMKVVLSGVPPEQSGTGTGTYGLFRDLAAPFGVAVFVPMFTNHITRAMSQGANETSAALSALRALTAAELLCVALGIAAVLALPTIRKGAHS